MELMIGVIGALLLIAALVKSATSNLTWILFRLNLKRWLTAGLALILLLAALKYLKD